MPEHEPIPPQPVMMPSSEERITHLEELQAKLDAAQGERIEACRKEIESILDKYNVSLEVVHIVRPVPRERL